MNQETITIGQASKMIGVSVQTLRRWDKTGRLTSVRNTKSGHRYYRKEDIENYQVKNLFKPAKTWIKDDTGFIPQKNFYCPDSSVFQVRLSKMQNELEKIEKLKTIFPLIVAVTGEIGNNSFDHNLGNWPDVPGIFFAYNLEKGSVALADRGQGILATLKKIIPSLSNHKDALYVAFTEIISGRAPESRGNGLKFVMEIVKNHPINLLFQTGNAYFEIKKRHSDLEIKKSNINLQGCLTLIKF